MKTKNEYSILCLNNKLTKAILIFENVTRPFSKICHFFEERPIWHFLNKTTNVALLGYRPSAISPVHRANVLIRLLDVLL